MLGCLDQIPIVDLDIGAFEPLGRTCLEAKGHHHRISGDDLFRPRHDFRTTTAILIRLAQARTNHFYAFDFVLTHYRYRLAVEQELDALFPCVSHFTARARHVLFIAAVGTGHAGGALTNRGAVTVHRGITTAQHHHALAFHGDKVVRVFLEAQAAVDVGN